MKKRFSILFVLLFVLLVGIGLPASPNQADALVDYIPGCAAFQDSSFAMSTGFGNCSGMNPQFVGFRFVPGDVLTVTAGPPDTLSPENVFLALDALQVTGPYPGSVSYTVTQEIVGVQCIRGGVTDGNATYTLSCVNIPPSAEDESVPGCDVLMNIPDTAVVGTFVTDALAYWSADASATTDVVIPAENTAWVLEKDASGAFYKIVWACDYLWVPVETLGPTYDDLWQGMPLP